MTKHEARQARGTPRSGGAVGTVIRPNRALAQAAHTRREVLAILVALAAAVFTPVKAMHAQVVSGQVALQERPGETTSDLRDAVAWLEPLGGSARPAPAGEVEMAMQGRQYTPRVVVVAPGGRVAFPNKDGFNHNVFSKSAAAPFDLGLYGRGKTKAQAFRAPGAHAVYCNVHPRMLGYVVVVPSALWAQATDDGRFTIDRVPPGRYKLVLWHSRAMMASQEVTVAANGTALGTLPMDARGYRYVQHTDKTGRDYKSATGDRY